MRIHLWIAMFAAAVTAAPGAAAGAAAGAEATISVNMGAEYTTGDYGATTDTTIGYFPLSLQYDSDVTSFSVTLPYLIVEGPGNVVPAVGDTPRGMAPGMGAMQVVLPGTGTANRTESGLGDVVLSGSMRLVSAAPARPRMDLTAKIKLATASASANLGTGENDYALQMDLEKGIFFGYLGYRVYGDPPGINLNNVAYGLAGLSYPLNTDTRAGLSLYAQQAAVTGSDDQIEIGLFLKRRFSRTVQLRPYVVFGLTDSSPNWGVGVTLALYR